MPTWNNAPARDGTRMSDHASPLRMLLKLEEGIEGLAPGFAPGEADAEFYLFERYCSAASGWKRKLYYSMKPVIPRPLQIAMRKRYARVQQQASFPAWPIETIMLRLIDNHLASTMKLAGVSRLHRIAPWPDGRQCAFVITHDVELEGGLAKAPALADLERSHGIVSSWNLVPERYPIDWHIVDRLRAGGFEIGVHGLHHDGKLFNSRRHFMRAASVINRYVREWGAEGFRSESTLRNPDWMPELAIRYDSSFPDTDPYEPQPGGCCTIWPYFIGNIVELPLTMPQDHTVFEILGLDDISIWKKKADWIVAQGGMVLLNVHPDYIFEGKRLTLYEEFLTHMTRHEAVWQALPRDVARWWRDRSASRLRSGDRANTVEGPSSARASIIRSSIQDGGVYHELLHPVPQTVQT